MGGTGFCVRVLTQNADRNSGLTWVQDWRLMTAVVPGHGGMLQGISDLRAPVGREVTEHPRP